MRLLSCWQLILEGTPIIEKDEKDFTQWFIRQCTKTNLALSDEEERRRYVQNPPYQKRMSKWIDKFYKPYYFDKRKDDDEERQDP